MRSRRSRSAVLTDWPPALRQLVRAAELECPRGHSEALLELIALAVRKVPSRGIFDPSTRDEQEMFTAIDAIARTHLELSEARAVWAAAVQQAGLPLEKRDAIETAALQVQTASDTAYFYAGLAFGLTFAYVYRQA